MGISKLTTHKTYQIIKDIPLMYMNGDEGFIFDSFKLGQVECCLFNKCVEQVKKPVIRDRHHFLINPGILKCHLRITCPDHLDAKQGHLGMWRLS